MQYTCEEYSSPAYIPYYVMVFFYISLNYSNICLNRLFLYFFELLKPTPKPIIKPNIANILVTKDIKFTLYS